MNKDKIRATRRKLRVRKKLNEIKKQFAIPRRTEINGKL